MPSYAEFREEVLVIPNTKYDEEEYDRVYIPYSLLKNSKVHIMPYEGGTKITIGEDSYTVDDGYSSMKKKLNSLFSP